MMGRLRIITIAATAGNVATSLADPPPGHRYRLLSARLTLVADANPATRAIRFRLLPAGGSVPVAPIMVSPDITAGQTNRLAIVAGAVTALGSAAFYEPTIACGDAYVWDYGNYSVSIDITAGLAGDSYSGYVVVEDIPG